MVADDGYHWQNGDLLNVDDKSTHITFIGTGISIHNIVTVGSQYAPGTIAQNLPYGTHILQLMRDDGDTYKHRFWIDSVYVPGQTSGYPTINNITFHQSKMPPIPEDAVVIADYMLMADFVSQPTTLVDYSVPKGVRNCGHTSNGHPTNIVF